MMRLLITGGAGFIGSNFVRYWARLHPNDDLTVVDKLTYAGNLENLTGLEKVRGYRLVKADISNPRDMGEVFDGPRIDVVVNFAAESHVDRSIEEPRIFLQTNIIGTQVLLELANKKGVGLFLQIGTDEVYGSLGPKGLFTEETPLAPNSPYSASKASADLIVRSYVSTFGVPAIISRCSNNYGPYQFPEKLIPLFVTNAMEGKPLPIYGDGLQVRDWLHVEDHCSALRTIILNGRVGEVYNIGGGEERTNLELTKIILGIMGIDESMIRFVQDRPGHDKRYAMDYSKLSRELGWRPSLAIEEGLRATISWYRENEGWWRRIKDGSYKDYYVRHYGKDLK